MPFCCFVHWHKFQRLTNPGPSLSSDCLCFRASVGYVRMSGEDVCQPNANTLGCQSTTEIADYPALSVDRAGGGNPLYAEDTPNQEFLIWCAPIQEFLIRCTPIQEFEFTDSVLVFVRGVIWHQEGYYCYIISQMNTFIINKILPRKCLPLLTACRHL